MKSHRVGPVAFLLPFVPLIFCSSLSAQTDQPRAVQLSGLLNRTDTNQRWESGVEGQIRWSSGAWSFGVGLQYTSSGKKGTIQGDPSDYHVNSLGLFLEPKFVVLVFADRFGLYVYSRVAASRMSESESGGTPGALPGSGLQPPYSVEGTRTGIGAYLGPGLLVRLTSRVNFDLGVTLGGTYWGDPGLGLQSPSKWLRGSTEFFVVGLWAGLMIGVG